MCTASSQSGTSTSSSSGASSTTSIAPVRTTEPNSGSKAWIAGAVAGPILGLALIGAGVWLFLRRKKKVAHTPHYGVAATDSSQPPAGVGGYTDAKPQYQPTQHAYPSPVQNQAYPQQGGFSPPQMSPAPQYAFQPSYNATPSPPLGAHAHDAKYEANREAEAAELGGSSTIVPESTNQRP
jgi:LPXTG-motif cell wall-anchored protein